MLKQKLNLVDFVRFLQKNQIQASESEILNFSFTTGCDFAGELDSITLNVPFNAYIRHYNRFGKMPFELYYLDLDEVKKIRKNESKIDQKLLLQNLSGALFIHPSIVEYKNNYSSQNSINCKIVALVLKNPRYRGDNNSFCCVFGIPIYMDIEQLIRDLLWHSEQIAFRQQDTIEIKNKEEIFKKQENIKIIRENKKMKINNMFKSLEELNIKVFLNMQQASLGIKKEEECIFPVLNDKTIQLHSFPEEMCLEIDAMVLPCTIEQIQIMDLIIHNNSAYAVQELNKDAIKCLNLNTQQLETIVPIKSWFMPVGFVQKIVSPMSGMFNMNSNSTNNMMPFMAMQFMNKKEKKDSNNVFEMMMLMNMMNNMQTPKKD